MGVVRREGSWRLNKKEEGVYEVTYEKRSELKIITSEYNPSGFDDERNDFSVQVQEVESFTDVERLFEEVVQDTKEGTEQVAESRLQADPIGSNEVSGEAFSLSELSPIGLFIVGFATSGFLIQQAELSFSSPLFLIGLAMLLLPVFTSARTYQVYRKSGPEAAIQFLISKNNGETESGNEGQRQDVSDSIEKTPPTPKKLRDEIYFDRANQHCEWCDERTDNPEVHHIEPRSEGGPNEHQNLIALCPTCHSKADSGGISRTKLRSKVSRQLEDYSTEK